MTDARVSQLTAEVLVTPGGGPARVSQLTAEVLVQSAPPVAARVSQLTAEVLVTPSSAGRFARVSQVTAEALITRGFPIVPPPPVPPGGAYTGHPPVRETYTWRSANGQIAHTEAYLDPQLPVNGAGADPELVEARFRALGVRLDRVARGAWQGATGPYALTNPAMWGLAGQGGAVADVLDLVAMSPQGELAVLRVPTCRWDHARGDLDLLLQYADLLLQDALVYWLSYFCTRSGNPIGQLVGGRRRRGLVPTLVTRYTRRPDLGGQAL